MPMSNDFSISKVDGGRLLQNYSFLRITNFSHSFSFSLFYRCFSPIYNLSFPTLMEISDDEDIF